MHTFYLMDGRRWPSLPYPVGHLPAMMPAEEQDDGDDHRDREPRDVEEEEAVHRVPRGRADDDDDRQQDERAEGTAAPPRTDVRGGRAARPGGPCGPGVGEVVEEAREVAAGLGGHGPADPLVELRLVEAAVGVVRPQLLGDRVPVRVGYANVLVGVADAARPLLGR